MKAFLKSLGIIFLYIVLSSVEYLIFNKIKTDSALINNFIQIGLSLVTVLIIALFMEKKLKGQWQIFKKNFKEYIPKSLKYWGCGFAIMFVANIIINVIIMKGIAPNEEANREIINLYPLYSIISVCIIAPIIEELIFRLNFKNVIKKNIAFIIFTGILFGAMHIVSSTSLIELIYIIPYSILGITFSKIYADTDNIFSSILAHALHNTITIIIILANI